MTRETPFVHLAGQKWPVPLKTGSSNAAFEHASAYKRLLRVSAEKREKIVAAVRRAMVYENEKGA